MKKMLITRRGFLLGATTAVATSALAGCASSVNRARVVPRKISPNEKVNLAIIGQGGKGKAHLGDFTKLSDIVNIVAVADPDTDHLKNVPTGIATYQDFRKLLERQDVDAVVVVTPDHWHCLAAIMAFQAGKHAYVEKPVSHYVWEGRKMVEAARKYNMIVQAGTQQRSCPSVQECAKDIQAGMYGKMLWAHCSVLSAREPIGKVTSPQAPPETLDYDLWAGPAPKSPVMRKKFHYDWHWQWNWGTGEMGNWGVHYLDDLRHMLGWNDVPGNVMAAGNRWWDDNGETPNMHMCLMEHRGVKVVVDVRNMVDPSIGDAGKQGAIYQKARGGNYLMCENAYISIARGGGKAFDKDGKMIKQYKGDSGEQHGRNFIDAVRAGSNKTLNAEIEVGHLSTVMCHMANIGFRMGKEAPVDQLRESIKQNEDAVGTLDAVVKQLEANKVDLKAKPFVVGPKLTFDAKTEQFTGDNAAEANKYIRLKGRKPFIIPEKL